MWDRYGDLLVHCITYATHALADNCYRVFGVAAEDLITQSLVATPISEQVLGVVVKDLVESLVATPITEQVFGTVAGDLTQSLVATPIT